MKQLRPAMPAFHPATPPTERTALISLARRQWLDGEAPAAGAGRIDAWITRSWQRCLVAGHRPQHRVAFDAVSAQAIRRVTERSAPLLHAARPVLARLTRAIVDTRYFAILTDADGIVIDVGAAPPEREARHLARVGVDLSERAVGTTAIGAALAERTSVWLHLGEHFFEDTSVYTCAGAPLFDPQGDCIGMLDLTGVNVVERPELRQLAERSAQAIENAMVRALPCALLLQFNWPGCLAELDRGADGDGLLCLDADGRVVGANTAARRLLPMAAQADAHCGDLFALPMGMLFEAAQRGTAAIEVPLWSGLRVQARAHRAHRATATAGLRGDGASGRLRDVEAALIRRAVDAARGNVAEAARSLGISRATVYRKLGRRPG